MNTKFVNKVCRAFFTFTFVLGAILVPHQSVKAQELNPRLDVFVTQDQIIGDDWPLGNVVTLTIDSPSTPQSPDYTTTRTVGPAPWNPSRNVAVFNLNRIFHYQVGDLITVSDGSVTKTHTVANVVVTRVDPVAETVSGTTDPGAEITVIVGGPIRKVTADADGQWSVNFTGMYDLTPNMNGAAMRYDNDGDASRADFPHPQIRANITSGNQWVTASDWPMGTVMTLTIDDPNTPQPIDYTAQAVIGHPRDPRETIAYFDLNNVFELKLGDVITMTDGIITKTLAIPQLQVTSYDIQADTFSGITTPGAQVQGCVHIPDQCINRYVTADGSGNWTANYHIPGTQPDEQQTVDIQFNMEVGAFVGDEDGDLTQVDRWLPNPNFDVRANYDQVEAFQWDMGNILTVKIDNPTTADDPDYTTTQTVSGFVPWDPSQTYVLFDLLGMYDIQTGDVVSVSDGSLTKRTIVTNLAITDVHLDTDMVYGTAEPNQTINVWTCWQNTCVNRDETADEEGHWVTNFAIPGEQDWEQDMLDVQPGSWIDSSVSDEDGDSTMFGWYVPIDTTPPTITWIGNIHDGDSFYFGFVPSEPACIASDNLSGVDGACTVTGYASTVGMHTLTATARDNAGNVATETRSYTVLTWTLKGFYQPVDMNGVYNIVKNGSTVPFKFEIFAGSTELTNITDVTGFTYIPVACDSNASVDVIETTVTGGTSLRYDTVAGQFIYNWKTPKTAGKCYWVTMTTIDGSSLVAYFKLK